MATNTFPVDTCGNHLADIIENNPGLRYDVLAFDATCRDLGQGPEAEAWSKDLSPHSDAFQIVANVPEDLKGHFLTVYKGRVQGSLAA